MRRIACGFLVATSLFGNQALQLGSGISASVELPPSAPYLGNNQVNSSFVYEFRIHGSGGSDIAIPASRSDLVAVNGNSSWWIFVGSDGTINVTDWWDGTTNNISTVYIGGRSDIICRVVRDVANMQFWIEVQNIDGTGYARGVVNGITSLGNGPSGAPRLASVTLGGGAFAAQLAWFRWRPYIVGQALPKETDAVSDGYWAAWQFENNGNDSSGNNANLTVSGGAYGTSPIYAPLCSAGVSQTFRSSDYIQLDASASTSLNNVAAMAYTWSLVSVPPTAPDPTWSTRSTVTPRVTGLIFGSYVFRLEVTDTTGQKTTCTVKHGVVATDANGNVIIANPTHKAYFDALGGTPAMISNQPPQTGVNRYPWYGDRARALGLTVARRLTSQFPAMWNVPLPGTISLVNACTNKYSLYGSGVPPTCAVVTGAGTNFQHDFCGDGSVPASGASIVIWYNSTITGNGTGRRQMPIYSCDSATQITLGRAGNVNPDGTPEKWNWITRSDALVGIASTDLRYSRIADADIGQWIDGRATATYYEAPAGLLYLYYATGIDDYLYAFRYITDSWYSIPQIDKSGTATPDMGWFAFAEPRSVAAVTSFMLRASEGGQSWMWPGIRRIVAYYHNDALGGGPVGDLRNAGFAMAWLAQMAIFDPDATQRDAWYQRVLSADAHTWSPYRVVKGNWNYWYAQDAGGGGFSFGGINQVYTGTASVANNSAVVTGIGTNFTAKFGPNGCDGYIWFSDSANTSLFTANRDINGDPDAYKVAVVASDSSLTLGRAYTGTSGTKQYGCIGSGNPDSGYNNTIVSGVQPFMLSIGAGEGFWWSRIAADPAHHNDPTSFATFTAYVVGIANWWKDHYSAANGGMVYWGSTPTAETVDAHCYTCDSANGPGDDGGMRINAMEGVSILYKLYAIQPSASLATFIDDALNILYAKPGTFGPTSDVRYIYSLDSAWVNQTNIYNPIPSKWFGYMTGLGANWRWFSQRIGGLAPPQPRTMQVTARFADHGAATKMRVTVMDPQGNESTPVVCASSPCTLTTPDARQGAHLYRVDLLDASNAVVLAGDYQILAVQ